mmetsp:Transcript_21644/g.34844  ORF Transcript_21644/g.34844 Transcript_21644/m.34844 type:complete len:190 (-) Transcript_21644:117-686(-)
MAAGSALIFALSLFVDVAAKEIDLSGFEAQYLVDVSADLGEEANTPCGQIFQSSIELVHQCVENSTKATYEDFENHICTDCPGILEKELGHCVSPQNPIIEEKVDTTKRTLKVACSAGKFFKASGNAFLAIFIGAVLCGCCCCFLVIGAIMHCCCKKGKKRGKGLGEDDDDEEDEEKGEEDEDDEEAYD